MARYNHRSINIFGSPRRPLLRRPRFWVAVVLAGILLLMVTSWIIRMLYPYPYRDLVEQQASRFSLDPLLVMAIIKAESNFQPGAISPRGARGLMQIMPDTGKWIASQMGSGDFQVEDLHNPAVNVQMGCWYLANLFQEFHGDRVLVLAAYNGGRGNVRTWLSDKRWNGKTASLEQIPFKETREYVAKVLRNYNRYRDIYADSR